MSCSHVNLEKDGSFPHLLDSAWLEKNQIDYTLTGLLIKQLEVDSAHEFGCEQLSEKHDHVVLYPRIKSETEIQELAGRWYDVILQMKTRQAKFYRSWRKYLKKEMNQENKNPQVIQNESVCLAYDYRIIFKVLTHPGISIEELELELDITPVDRFHQAVYLVEQTLRAKTKTKDEKDWKPSYFKKSEISSEKIFESLYNPDIANFENLFESPFDRLKLSEGWLHVYIYTLIGGHALLVRWDEERQHYWIIDSSIGFFRFDRPPHQVEKAEQNCIRCLRQILSTFYPFTYKVKGCLYYVSLTNNQ